MTRCLLLLTAVVACGGSGNSATTSPTTTDTLPGGAIHVVNRGPAEWDDTAGWRLVLERTIPSAASGPGLLASPRNIVATSAGEIVVLDRRPARLVRFAATGELIGTIGREGAGPAEFADFGDLGIVGDTLVVVDRGNARLVLFRTDGTSLGSAPGARGPLVGPISDDGRIPLFSYLAQRPTTASDNYAGSGVRRVTTDGRTADSLFYPPEPLGHLWTLVDASHDLGAVIPFTPSRVYAFDRAGRLLWGDQDHYRILVSHTGTDTTLMIDAAAPAVTIPDSVRQAQLDEMRADAEWLRPIAKLDDIPTEYPAWTDLRADAAGNIWVLRPTAGTGGGVFDVFTPQGRLRGRVPAPFSTLDYSYWTTDHVYRIGTSEAGDPQIEVWRIVTTD